MEDYRTVANSIAADILSGKLRPGDRLPPQREFAQSYGIAPSTAGRAYRELVRRGLIIGEVGRGSFVRMPIAAGKGHESVDLQNNFPVLASQSALMAPALNRILRRPESLAAALRPVDPAVSSAARSAAAQLLAQHDWHPDESQVLFAGNGKQAIAAALAALTARGDRIGVERLTYPQVKELAARMGLELVALEMDEQGVTPQAIRDAHATHAIKAVYLQPTLHNPTGATQSEARRRELGALLTKLGIVAVEDSIYAFLADSPPPIARFAPDHCIVVDSLSKRLAPGLTLGILAVPLALRDAVFAAIRAGAWTPSAFSVEAAVEWITQGTVDEICQAKRRDAHQRMQIARRLLRDLDLRWGDGAYHCWLMLPAQASADAFAVALARDGISVTPASAFNVAGLPPAAVRLALSQPPKEILEMALQTIARRARSPGSAWQTE
ncbi:aminotransferase-like domain-containing protein [Trinickia acidisoli]|uniref:aminotransferase-like domain-containing protein n=1 Tax=Trinickia acidisoli TaxID=2767482 RepID=UPI001A8D5F4B|nr:PLP-dependent aminotransferase family protein [Trinickia acidisoli]